MKIYTRLTVGTMLLSSFLLPSSSIHAESENLSDKTIDSKELIEEVLEKDSLIPSAPSVQTDMVSSETEQKETTISEKEESQKQEENTNNLITEENNKEASKVRETEASEKNLILDPEISNKQVVESNQTDEINQKKTKTSLSPDGLHYNNDYLISHFNVEYVSGSWGECYKVTGVKAVDLSNYTRITLPSMVYDRLNPSKSYQVQITQDFWNDIRSRPQDFKDSIKTFEIIQENGHKIIAWENKNWDLSFLFGSNTGQDTLGYRNLTSVDLSGLNWKAVNNTAAMFQKCVNLTTATLGNGTDYLNIINVSYMFNNCFSLQTIQGLENAEFSKVSNMANMFYGCSSLTSLDVSNWNTSLVTSMERLFQRCSSLTSLDVSKWDTSLVTSMGAMFQDTSSLSELNLSNWNTKSLQETWWMFAGTGVKNIDLSNFNISNLNDAHNMFYYSDSMSINLSTWNPTQTRIDMTEMFKDCPSLRQVDMRGFTNLDSQITTTILGTAQAANPIMLITGDSSGNNTFIARDFQKESGRIPMPMPELKTSNDAVKLSNGKTQQSYLTTIPVYPSTLEKTSFDTWLNQSIPKSQVINNMYYYVKDVTPSKDVSTASSVLDLLDTTYTANVIDSDWEFKYDSADGTYELVKYLGTNPDIIVPNEIDGKPT
ncbi:DUF285 domain-containing protein, partial [Enterococcus faecalis]|uniref:DUF285 domain-containing protein n=1 Tax=Enterococcus faecalis TaxID=1351 RepID=UPI001CE028ED